MNDEERPQPISKTQRYDRAHLEAPKPKPKPRDEKFFIASTINQRELDSSSYRLSRVPQRLSQSKINKVNQPQSFVEQYFANNPNATVDTRTPAEKLDDIQARLGDENIENDPTQKLDLIVQQKTLTSLVHGENSIENTRSLIAIGAFYNTQHLPESAMRHLKKAKPIAEGLKKDEERFNAEGDPHKYDEDLLRLHVEITDAKMQTPSNSPKKSLYASFEKVLAPYKDKQTEDKKLNYRRNYYLAEIYYNQNKFSDALPYYDSTIVDFQEINPNEEQKPELAKIYVHAAESAVGVEDIRKAKNLYENALSIYKDLGKQNEIAKYQQIVDELAEQIREEETKEAEAQQPADQINEEEEEAEDNHVIIQEPEQQNS